MTKYCNLPGSPIDHADCIYWRTKEIVRAVRNLSFFELVECRKDVSLKQEIVVLDVDIEISQKRVYDILPTERIAIVIREAENEIPDVWALRENFPRVPHLNVRREVLPRSLCLSDEPYSEARLRWTAPNYLNWLRQWLSKTADGELHQEDQSLEPLLPPGSPKLLVQNFLLTPDTPEFIEISPVVGDFWYILKAEPLDKDKGHFGKVACLLIPIEGEPQIHGVMERNPKSLIELHELLANAKIDLFSVLDERLMALKTKHAGAKDRWMFQSWVVITVRLPKKRGLAVKIEATDHYAFVLKGTIDDIADDIGTWKKKAWEPIIVGSKGSKTPVEVLDVILPFSREMAARSSGLEKVETRRFLLVGAGALGSQVLTNFVRMGFGQWTIIDKDWFLSHNLARHALTGHVVGYPKAVAASLHAQSIIICEPPVSDALIVNILSPENQSEKLGSEFEKASVIVDSSASVAVARHIARDIASSARRISIFFNPKGLDGVVIAEDSKRHFRLDELEMQYYRAILEHDVLKDHLVENERRVRYARSCGDISNSIPQDLVSFHAAFCTRAIQNVLKTDSPCITIWKIDPASLEVTTLHISTTRMKEQHLNGWTVCTDEKLVEKAFQARMDKLPNETGGVLVGSYDMQRKIIYAVDILISPPDSQHWPGLYIRGVDGLRESVASIQRATADNLTYIGEWHSHPPDRSTLPSDIDREAMKKLQDEMSREAVPALMFIIGDDCNYSWNLDYE